MHFMYALTTPTLQENKCSDTYARAWVMNGDSMVYLMV